MDRAPSTEAVRAPEAEVRGTHASVAAPGTPTDEGSELTWSRASAEVQEPVMACCDLVDLVDGFQATDVLMDVSVSTQGSARMALRVVWPTWTAGTKGSRPGCRNSYGCFECRLVDVEGDSCIFIAYVEGNPSSKAVKHRSEQLMAMFCHNSVWIVTEFRGLTCLKSTLSSGCTVRVALVWHAHAVEPPARFHRIRAQSWLDWRLPREPMPVLGQPLFFASHLVDLSGPCPAYIAEQTSPRTACVVVAQQDKEEGEQSRLRRCLFCVDHRCEARDDLFDSDLQGCEVLPARVADVVSWKGGSLAVQLGNAAGGRAVPVACAVVAVRCTCESRLSTHWCTVAVRCDGIADALPGPALPRSVDLVVLVPYPVRRFGLKKDEVALVVVNEAVMDDQGRVCELVATHAWKLSGGHEGMRELESFAEQVRAACAPVPPVAAGSRKRPASVCMRGKPCVLRCSPGVPICQAVPVVSRSFDEVDDTY